AADLLLDAERVADNAREEAHAAAVRALDRLKAEGKWDEEKERRKRLLNLVRAVKAGAARPHAGLEESDAEAVKAVDVWRAALARVEEARAEYEKEFNAGVARVSGEISRLAGEGRFREAVTWQNRRALQSCLDYLASRNGTRDSRRRQHEELAASYLQRYCVKNDTIGFFGPVAWARLDETEGALKAEPGAEFLAARQVYFEGWGVDMLAAQLNGRRELRPWMPPRLLPFARVEGDTLHLPFKAPMRLPARQAAVLRACDGERTAKEIAGEVLRASAVNGAGGEREVYALLEAFASQGLIGWGFEVPLESYPERTLRRLLERIGDDAARREALTMLDDYEAARAAVSAAAGNADTLAAAIDNLEGVFTRLTGEASTRSSGKTYAGRTLVYEDCRRDIQATFGRDLVDELAAPLSLLLRSARWFTYQVAVGMRRSFGEIYARLASRSGNRVVDGVSFWTQAQASLFGSDLRVLDEVRSDFQRRWADVLNLEPGGGRREYTSEALREKVEAAFDAPHAGWSYARYHSPDVMIAADGAEAVRRGEYQFVLGEIHVALNTLSAAFQIAQHPEPAQLFQALEADLPQTRLVSVPPKEWVSLTARTRVALVSPKDFRLVFGNDPTGVAPSQAVPIAELVVEERGGSLVVRTRDGRLCLDIVEALSDALSNLVVDHFKLMRPQGRNPRVSIDRLVVARESWYFAPASLGWAWVKDEAERFAAARRWARAEGLPRRCFMKVAVEPKPSYVDFDSPIYVGLMAKSVRRTAEAGEGAGVVAVSEMLPEVNETWLPDAEGRHYTSELRIVALDLARP
ncbi:MAG TPA: lantibiotic dehydratase, partial [Pyrinomonadaceae bacterium]